MPRQRLGICYFFMASYRASDYGPTPAVLISKNDGTLWMVNKVNPYDPNSTWTPWRRWQHGLIMIMVIRVERKLKHLDKR